MSCTEFSSITSFLASKIVLQERIDAIDVLIDKAILLLGETVEGAGGNISSYELDDGQVRIKTGYRSLTEVSAGIDALEKMKTRYINQLYGRSVTLVDLRTICR